MSESDFICEFCNKTYSSKGNLKKHQRYAGKCLKLRGLEPEKNILCEYCQKYMPNMDRFNKHTNVCRIKKLTNGSIPYKKQCEKLQDDLAGTKEYYEKIISNMEENHEKNIEDLQKEHEISVKILKDKHDVEMYSMQTRVDELRETIENIAVSQPSITKLINENKIMKRKIEDIMNNHAKTRSRIQYPKECVIYLIASENMEQQRRYKIGKTKDLTKRLTTYNTTDDHKVIFKQPCNDQETMGLVEKAVFHKLRKHRCQQNREWFELPDDKPITYFVDTIKNCFETLF